MPQAVHLIVPHPQPFFRHRCPDSQNLRVRGGERWQLVPHRFGCTYKGTPTPELEAGEERLHKLVTDEFGSPVLRPNLVLTRASRRTQAVPRQASLSANQCLRSAE